MIDKGRFIAGMAALGGAFGREIEEPVQRLYYAVLGAKMTTAEFEQAVGIVVATETFWPSPATLLMAVNADEQSQGLAAFEHVNRVTGQHGGFRFLSHATYHEAFDAPTKAAIAAVGGLASIANTSEERWGGLQKRFLAAYREALHPSLPAPPTDGRVRQLVERVSHRLSNRDRATGERDEHD